MTAKMFRIASIIVLASFAPGSAAWATCSNASVSGAYGLLGRENATLEHLTFDSTTGKFTGTITTSTDGVIETGPITGTYAVASNCTVTGTFTVGGKTHPFSALVTSTGGVQVVNGETGTTAEYFLLAQGSPTCTNAGVKGSFGLEATGDFLAGAPFTGPLALIGELVLSVNASGEGVISGRMAGSENGTILTFAEEPVTGSYSVSANCTGTASITPEGKSTLNYSFVVVSSGKELLAIETDEHTVVTGTVER